MIAGLVELGGHRFRIATDLAAVCRIAAAAGIGLIGHPGHTEVRRFADAVVDRRDRRRWHRAAARADPGEYAAALALAIALNLATAANSGDPLTRRWAADMRGAIVAFRSGDPGAFRQLAARHALALTLESHDRSQSWRSR